MVEGSEGTKGTAPAKKTVAKHAAKKTAKKKAAPAPAKKQHKKEDTSVTWNIDRGFLVLVLLCIGVLVFLGYLYLAGQDAQQTDMPADVVAYVNGLPITQSEVDLVTKQVLSINPAATPDIVLNQTIMLELLHQRAAALNITVDELELEIVVAQRDAIFRQQYGEEVYYDILEKNNFTEESFKEYTRNAVRDDMLITRVFEQDVFINVQNVTDGEALTFYEENAESYLVPETRSISHILLCFEGATGCAPENTQSKEDALAQTQEILAEIQAHPDRFEELAKNYSTGPSGPNGGSIGESARNLLVAPFADVAFTARVGEISEPVETEFGYHIIRVDDILPPRTLDFDEVKDDIKGQLQAQAAGVVQREYMLNLYRSANITLVN